MILEYIEKNDKATYRSLVMNLERNRSTVQNTVRRLAEHGFIERRIAQDNTKGQFTFLMTDRGKRLLQTCRDIDNLYLP